MSDRLFDLEESVKVTEPRARVNLIVGMLAYWTFGDEKPKKAQLDALEDIAAEALARARATK